MKSFPGILLTVFFIIIVSCTPRVTGYAVVLWPEHDSPFTTGEILPIVNTSQLSETATVLAGDEQHVLSLQRISIFDEESAARAFQENFEPWNDLYARSLITALPVRSMPDRSSTRLYRLRDGEMVKIIEREEESSDVGGLVDFWYNVLTENGVTGWVFGRNLELVSAGGRPLTPRDDKDRLDRLVRDIASTTWRPDFFIQMTRSGRINLDQFSPRYGLFGDFEQSTFRIVMPSYRKEFSYDDYSSSQRNQVNFQGSDLTLELIGDERVRATFLLNDRQRTETFVLFNENIGEIVLAERARRESILQQFLARGTGLISTAFGTIELSQESVIRWEGYERLVPNILPAGFDGIATMQFSLFIADDLRNRYDGALRFVMGGGIVRSFLYTLTDDGIRLVYLPPNLISSDNLVESEPASPVILFFRFYQS